MDIKGKEWVGEEGKREWGEGRGKEHKKQDDKEDQEKEIENTARGVRRQREEGKEKMGHMHIYTSILNMDQLNLISQYKIRYCIIP